MGLQGVLLLPVLPSVAYVLHDAAKSVLHHDVAGTGLPRLGMCAQGVAHTAPLCAVAAFFCVVVRITEEGERLSVHR